MTYTCDFFQKAEITRAASLVQINSKLNSKPSDHQDILLDEVEHNRTRFVLSAAARWMRWTSQIRSFIMSPAYERLTPHFGFNLVFNTLVSTEATCT